MLIQKAFSVSRALSPSRYLSFLLSVQMHTATLPKSSPFSSFASNNHGNFLKSRPLSVYLPSVSFPYSTSSVSLGKSGRRGAFPAAALLEIGGVKIAKDGNFSFS
jgi:hypothetical protein